MRLSIAVIPLVLALTATHTRAQFGIPLPPPRSDAEIRREDYRRGFVRTMADEARRAILRGDTNQVSTATIDEYCDRRTSEAARTECRDALTPSAIRAEVTGRTRPITRVLLRPRPPLAHTRADLAEYLRSAGATEGLAVFAQFAANVSDKEAYVVSNIIRGLTGPTLFSIDYAAVVTKAEGETEEEREEIEDDKANLLRMINNGGTVVARFHAPIHAISGGTYSSASAVSVGGGLIGPIGSSDGRHGAGSVVGEYMSSIAIRDLEGSGELRGELLVGARAGYSISDSPLVSDSRDKGIGFGQAAIGLRRNGVLSLSVLLTYTEKHFRDAVPKLLVNFSAIR